MKIMTDNEDKALKHLHLLPYVERNKNPTFTLDTQRIAKHIAYFNFVYALQKVNVKHLDSWKQK